MIKHYEPLVHHRSFLLSARRAALGDPGCRLPRAFSGEQAFDWLLDLLCDTVGQAEAEASAPGVVDYLTQAGFLVVDG